ncbi:MAG: hypothetical protein P8Y44_11785 [Acidobacteriota bacterium]
MSGLPSSTGRACATASLWALWLLSPALLLAVSPQTGAPVVSAIEIRSDNQDLPLDVVENLITVEVGEPLDSERVASSLRNLQASGLASEIEAYRRSGADGGAVLTFVLWGRIQVESVRLEGELGLRRSELMSVLEVGPAEPPCASIDR